MIFDLEKIVEYDPEEFKVNFKTLITVNILTDGYISEKRLQTPCKNTRMSIEQIFKYQESGYRIIYDDTYLEEMFYLAKIYNARLTLSHSKNENLHLSPLVKTLDILKKKMIKYPKYNKLINELNIRENPYINPDLYQDSKKNSSSMYEIERLYRKEIDTQKEEANPLTYEDLEYGNNIIDNYITEFMNINKGKIKSNRKLYSSNKIYDL